VVTWFTFLPSFIFILAGGPFIESTRKNLQFTAPLAAITAAVVGVIVSLALFFGEHVFWPQGLDGRFDFSAALIAMAAAVALIRFKRPVVQVIAACALAGWGLSMLA
jgi:chromate transporter